MDVPARPVTGGRSEIDGRDDLPRRSLVIHNDRLLAGPFVRPTARAGRSLATEGVTTGTGQQEQRAADVPQPEPSSQRDARCA